jgi:transcriptional regulator with XRE-family HTH domain
MSNYIEYGDKIAFHPGYYIKEIVEESGLTQEDFAKRLGTTPKNLSLLIRGEQSLSIDMAMSYRMEFELSADAPNTETIEAIQEVKRMKNNPGIGKTYTDVDQMMKELLADV